MLEKEIERFVRTKLSGYLLKWVSPGETGVPDRMLIIPGKVIFIEFKKPGGKLSPRQQLWIDRLREMKQDVRVICGIEEAKEFVNEIQTTHLSRTHD